MNNKGNRRIFDRIEDIRTADANIRSGIGSLDKDAFLNDGRTQRAVIASLIVIGEAAARILQTVIELESAQPDAWQRLRDANGMRNILAHEYFRIDAEVVWDTIHNDLQPLESSLDLLAAAH